MRDVYEVLREKENGLEQLRREVQALRLTVRLVDESEDSPLNIENLGGDVETHSAEGGRAITLSMRLRRMAAPLLATFAR